MKSLEGLNICVTGGNGFIGRHLVRRLVSLDARVKIIDISVPQSQLGVSYEPVDITNYTAVQKATMGSDVIYHMAASSFLRSVENPHEDFQTTLLGAFNVLSAAKENHVSQVIFSSSYLVYGQPRIIPVTEDHPCQPLSPYGVSKLAAEHYFRVFNLLYDVRSLVMRYTNVYGPGQGGRYLVPTLMEAARNNKPITIHGTGKQTRDFVFVEDVVDANILALQRQPDCGILNVGSGKSTTVLDLVYEVAKIADTRITVSHEKERQLDVPRFEASIGAATRTLGYVPHTDLRTGLEKTWHATGHRADAL